ncbi:hypothetical protein [Agathobacter rectalis]|uniref:hypothetical protein n=1 Tax=Agathobacter rectalis TaxID=39491 RepID=UPI001570055B|nr:hypothetical protein [Agathobacter rectalis]NSI33943.1 hypothetical protein [Agathobacter rectalis]NSI86734.1 hypothetical protein [Agathobacter rectalis]
MKRKIITAILAITVVFSAASCGSAENKSSNTQEATVSDMQNSTERVSEAAGDTQSEEMTATVNDGENVPGSGTSKSDTSDAAASSSADSKNADSTVKKNSSDSKSSTKNSTSTAVNHNSTQSTGASTAKTDSSSGTANKPAAHTHTWVKYVANTIQHEEQGHYETKVVKAAYDEPKYEEHNVCNKCGYDMGTDDWNVLNHENICDGSYSCIPVQVGTIHHDAETTQVWVVDKPAYTEYVYGEKCSVCGATK